MLYNSKKSSIGQKRSKFIFHPKSPNGHNVSSNRVKKVLAFTFFALMMVKVSAFHVYCHISHDKESIKHCGICDVALVNQHSQLNFADEIDFVSALFVLVPEEKEFKVGTPTPESRITVRLCTRPPPYFI